MGHESPPFFCSDNGLTGGPLGLPLGLTHPHMSTGPDPLLAARIQHINPLLSFANGFRNRQYFKSDIHSTPYGCKPMLPLTGYLLPTRSYPPTPNSPNSFFALASAVHSIVNSPSRSGTSAEMTSEVEEKSLAVAEARLSSIDALRFKAREHMGGQHPHLQRNNSTNSDELPST